MTYLWLFVIIWLLFDNYLKQVIHLGSTNNYRAWCHPKPSKLEKYLDGGISLRQFDWQRIYDSRGCYDLSSRTYATLQATTLLEWICRLTLHGDNIKFSTLLITLMIPGSLYFSVGEDRKMRFDNHFSTLCKNKLLCS